jgi:ankyrin repeat protein
MEVKNEPLSIRRRHGVPSLRSIRGGNNPAQNTDGKASKDDLSSTGFQFMKAASDGDTELLHTLLAKDPHLIHYSDPNNWQALHESIRSGKLEVVKYLIDQGSDVGWSVKGGGPALWVARQLLPKDHEVTKYLESVGAPEH